GAGIQGLGAAGEVHRAAGVVADRDAAAGVVGVVDVAGKGDRAAGAAGDRSREAAAVADGAAVAERSGAAVDAELRRRVAGEGAPGAGEGPGQRPPERHAAAPARRAERVDGDAEVAAIGDVDRLARAGDVDVGHGQVADRGAAVVDAYLGAQRGGNIEAGDLV